MQPQEDVRQVRRLTATSPQEALNLSVRQENSRLSGSLAHVVFPGIVCRMFHLDAQRSALYAMRSLPGRMRELDLMFISTTNLGQMRPEALDGPAYLVVEVVSEESVARDDDEKFTEYETAGVQEDWIIDSCPNRERSAFYQRVTSGRFQPVRTDGSDAYPSAVLPGFRLKLGWVWQSEPEPEALRALTELIGVDKLAAVLCSRQQSIRRGSGKSRLRDEHNDI